MTQYSYYPASIDMPLYLPTADWTKDNLSPIKHSSTYQQFLEISPFFGAKSESSLKDSDIQMIPKNGIENAETMNENEMEQGVSELIAMQQQWQELDNKTPTLSSTEKTIKILQFWIGDFVLKGGAGLTQTGIPFILHTNLDSIPSLGPVTEYIKVFTDLIDSGSGIAGLIYRQKIINTAYIEITRLKHQKLNSEQQHRLEQLEAVIHTKEIELSSQGLEQFFRTVRNIFSYAAFALSWVEKNPVINTLATVGNALILGFNAVLSGVFFYQAREDLQIGQSWSKEFKAWIKKPTAFLHVNDAKPPEMAQLIKDTAEQLMSKRKERSENQLQHIQIIKERLNRNEINLDIIKARLLKFMTQQSIDEIKTEDDLISKYIEHHAILDPTIKGALIEMVKKKQQVEKSILKIKKVQTGARFTVATIIFGVALTFAIIGLVATPIGAAALILTIFGIASVVISLGLLGAGYYYAYQKKPAVTAATLKGLYVRPFIYRCLAKIHEIKATAENYIRKNCRKKRDKLAHYINESRLFEKVFNPQIKRKTVEIITPSSTIQEIRDDFEKKQIKAQELRNKAKALQNELDQLPWKDFTQQAGLKIAIQSTDRIQSLEQFDTLETLNYALNHADFNLLSVETKELLERQLGISVQFLQQKIGQDPSTIKKLLKAFFSGDDVAFVQFINEQKLMKTL